MSDFERKTYKQGSPVKIDRGVELCPKCGNALKRTGGEKYTSPPLDVVRCDKCKLEYWRRSECRWPKIVI